MVEKERKNRATKKQQKEDLAVLWYHFKAAHLSG